MTLGLSVPKVKRSVPQKNFSYDSLGQTMTSEAGQQLTSEMLRAMEIDSTPRALFVEMDELKGNVWQEQAR